MPRAHRLDVTGTLCPVPLLLTARCLRGLDTGARLEVVGDDPEMLRDIPDWCRESGHRLLHIEQRAGLVRCLLEKAAPRPEGE